MNDNHPESATDRTDAEQVLSNIELVEVRIEDSLATLESRIDSLFDDLETREGELLRQAAEIQQRSHQIALRESKTRLQRRRIAEELRAQRAELSSGVAGGDRSEKERLVRETEDLRRELRLQRDLADEAIGETSSLREKLGAAGGGSESFEELQQELIRSRDEIAALKGRHESPGSVADLGKFELLEAELADSREEAKLAQEALQLSQEALERSQSEVDQLLAEQDRIEAESSDSVMDCDGLDWESQKARLLESLAADTQGAVEEQVKAVERAVDVVDNGAGISPEEMERLHDKLTALMSALAAKFGDEPESFDFAAALDEERQTLRAIQQEWHDKLRDSELEISVERAKLAREKVQLEEELRKLQFEKEKLVKPDSNNESDAPVARSRWLARLGLADE